MKIVLFKTKVIFINVLADYLFNFKNSQQLIIKNFSFTLSESKKTCFYLENIKRKIFNNLNFSILLGDEYPLVFMSINNLISGNSYVKIKEK